MTQVQFFCKKAAVVSEVFLYEMLSSLKHPVKKTALIALY